MSVLISAISYLFDAYPPQGTLSALTAAACVRLALAGVLPLVIVQMILGLTGAWAYSVFGFVAAAMVPLPWLLFRFGPGLRANSTYGFGAMAVQSDIPEQAMKDMSNRDSLHSNV